MGLSWLMWLVSFLLLLVALRECLFLRSGDADWCLGRGMNWRLMFWLSSLSRGGFSHCGQVFLFDFLRKIWYNWLRKEVKYFRFVLELD